MPTTTAPWPAPYAERPLDATVSLPGSKSLTNRVLVLAAIADGPSRVTAPLRARDTALMVEALRALGTTVTDDGTDDGPDAGGWTVVPGLGHGPVDVDCGLAGTVMRFVPPVAALLDGAVSFDGDPRARERPMAVVVGALRDLGVEVDDGGRAALPFVVRGRGRVPGGVVTIDASASSQFVSALLLAGARYDRGVDVRHVGRPVPSMPHVEMTISQLRARGVEVDDTDPDRWVVRPGPVAALDVRIEPDLSNAGAFVGAALVTGGRVRVRDWPRETDQAGDRWREIATLAGAAVVREGEDLVVTAPETLEGLQLDLHDVGELTPVVAAVAAVAGSPSHLTGIGHLRGHETDRLAAIATELTRLGAEVVETADALTIRPRPLHGAVFATYDDHRMAHAAAVLGLVVPGLEVADVATTAKTYPGFADAWTGLLA